MRIKPGRGRDWLVKIHIVEDDPGVRDSLSVLLRNKGYSVCSYPDAESFFRSDPPQPGDSVIVDLLLPGIGGAALLRWLHRLYMPPRIIVMSGRPEKEIEQDLRGMKVSHVVRKPLGEDVITAYLSSQPGGEDAIKSNS